MATQGIEEVTENAIRAVARDCGSLSIECSDVAGYVERVAERIVEHQKVLDALGNILDIAGDVAAFDRQRAAVARHDPNRVFGNFFNAKRRHVTNSLFRAGNGVAGIS